MGVRAGARGSRLNYGCYYLVVAKFKPVKAKKPRMAAPQGALPCVVLVIIGFVLVMLFLYFGLRNANG